MREDWAPALVAELGPGETVPWEAASYLDAAGAEGATCQVAAVEHVPEGAAGAEKRWWTYVVVHEPHRVRGRGVHGFGAPANP